MRLGQLSRQIGVKSQEIVEYLETQDIAVKSGSNAKVEDEHVPLIHSYFGYEPETIVEEVEEEADVIENTTLDAPPEVEQTSIPPSVPADVLDDPLLELEAFHNDLPEDEEFSEEELAAIKERVAKQTKKKEEPEPEPEIENPNLIKAPKQFLQGLKVVGKIDLPEPKPKEVPEENTEEIVLEEAPEKPIRQKREQRSNRSRRNPKNNLNPVELKRQQEAKTAEAQKRRKVREEKKRKKAYYQKQLALKKQAEREAKVAAKEVEIYEPSEQRIKPKSKNPLARLWRWLDAKEKTE